MEVTVKGSFGGKMTLFHQIDPSRDVPEFIECPLKAYRWLPDHFMVLLGPLSRGYPS